MLAASLELIGVLCDNLKIRALSFITHFYWSVKEKRPNQILF